MYGLGQKFLYVFVIVCPAESETTCCRWQLFRFLLQSSSPSLLFRSSFYPLWSQGSRCWASSIIYRSGVAGSEQWRVKYLKNFLCLRFALVNFWWHSRTTSSGLASRHTQTLMQNLNSPIARRIATIRLLEQDEVVVICCRHFCLFWFDLLVGDCFGIFRFSDFFKDNCSDVHLFLPFHSENSSDCGLKLNKFSS